MLPYLTLPPFTVFGLEIRPFFLLVVTGIIAGVIVYDRICKKGGRIDRRIALHLPELCVLGGFIGAHLVHVLFYHPELLNEDPWVLFKFWGGLSSIGGFLGGMSAAVGYLLYKKQPLLPYGDRLLSALVVGWIFGRTGCSFAHDHPGRLTDFFLGIQYPGGVRHDLGFYELLLTLVIGAVLLVINRKARHSGTQMAVILLMYAPVRFGFDFLRAPDVRFADSRYLGLTPAQYGVIVLFFAGVYLLLNRRKQPLDIAFLGNSGSAREKTEPSTPTSAPQKENNSAAKKTKATATEEKSSD